MPDHPSGRTCPICGKPEVRDFHPFCSKRCADVDLNRWLSGAYVVPGAQDEDEDGLLDDNGGASVGKQNGR